MKSDSMLKKCHRRIGIDYKNTTDNTRLSVSAMKKIKNEGLSAGAAKQCRLGRNGLEQFRVVIAVFALPRKIVPVSVLLNSLITEP